MATPQSLLDVLTALDNDTTALAAVVESLRNAVKENMTAEDVAEVQSKLTEVSARLKGIASDPETPVPVDPPVEPMQRRW